MTLDSSAQGGSVRYRWVQMLAHGTNQIAVQLVNTPIIMLLTCIKYHKQWYHQQGDRSSTLMKFEQPQIVFGIISG